MWLPLPLDHFTEGGTHRPWWTHSGPQPRKKPAKMSELQECRIAKATTRWGKLQGKGKWPTFPRPVSARRKAEDPCIWSYKLAAMIAFFLL